MTEERKKELVEEYEAMLIQLAESPDDKWVLSKLIDTVAAESRAEGIDAHIRMLELEAEDHDMGADNCLKCQEYRRLKGEG